jgi:hypothetical protein
MTQVSDVALDVNNYILCFVKGFSYELELSLTLQC